MRGIRLANGEYVVSLSVAEQAECQDENAEDSETAPETEIGVDAEAEAWCATETSLMPIYILAATLHVAPAPGRCRSSGQRRAGIPDGTQHVAFCAAIERAAFTSRLG